MPLTAISIQGYRSIQRLYFDVDACSIFVGANGVGKTNLYKALGLLRAAADGTLTRAIAQEGGIESVLWAGRRPGNKPVRLALSAHFETLQYDVEVGLPPPPPFNTEAAFTIEPLIREERLIMRTGQRKVAMMERKGPMVALRNEDGAREVHKAAVLSSETALAAFPDASRYPEIEIVRRELLEWRLYHDFRTDEASPIRQPCMPSRRRR
ncbi:MAG TPA: DUF2813 domain-containing protein [Dongiaceae bacterium]|jgi:predicted ATPase|nr:DUF2813 domain-containing protein [Dongiaceae bacterium]